MEDIIRLEKMFSEKDGLDLDAIIKTLYYNQNKL